MNMWQKKILEWSKNIDKIKKKKLNIHIFYNDDT